MLMPGICLLQWKADAILDSSKTHCASASPSYGAPGVAMPSRLQRLRGVLLNLNNCRTSVSAALCELQVSSMVLPASDAVLPSNDHRCTVPMPQVTLKPTQWLKLIKSADVLQRSHLSRMGGHLDRKLSPGCLKLISVRSHRFLVCLALGQLDMQAFFLCLQGTGHVMRYYAWILQL